ncbi:hypothetical protein CTI12_AA229720 [Artemisia annua]|uniref:Uncharacterized protein n=1 Tax=Artemisia annua TaxID=35608 RepID=A0A2U1NTG5_ARTAN|nr:hypothetical protein CTI12_AA229720 [Artemisia annua]
MEASGCETTFWFLVLGWEGKVVFDCGQTWGTGCLISEEGLLVSGSTYSVQGGWEEFKLMYCNSSYSNCGTFFVYKCGKLRLQTFYQMDNVQMILLFCGLACAKRVDVVIFVIWELVILAFFVFSAVSLYFRQLKLAIVLATVTLLLLLSMKVTKHIKLARKKKRRMLLPLSM